MDMQGPLVFGNGDSSELENLNLVSAQNVYPNQVQGGYMARPPMSSQQQFLATFQQLLSMKKVEVHQHIHVIPRGPIPAPKAPKPLHAPTKDSKVISPAVVPTKAAPVQHVAPAAHVEAKPASAVNHKPTEHKPTVPVSHPVTAPLHAKAAVVDVHHEDKAGKDELRKELHATAKKWKITLQKDTAGVPSNAFDGVEKEVSAIVEDVYSRFAEKLDAHKAQSGPIVSAAVTELESQLEEFGHQLVEKWKALTSAADEQQDSELSQASVSPLPEDELDKDQLPREADGEEGDEELVSTVIPPVPVAKKDTEPTPVAEEYDEEDDIPNEREDNEVVTPSSIAPRVTQKTPFAHQQQPIHTDEEEEEGAGRDDVGESVVGEQEGEDDEEDVTKPGLIRHEEPVIVQPFEDAHTVSKKSKEDVDERDVGDEEQEEGGESTVVTNLNAEPSGEDDEEVPPTANEEDVEDGVNPIWKKVRIESQKLKSIDEQADDDDEVSPAVTGEKLPDELSPSSTTPIALEANAAIEKQIEETRERILAPITDDAVHELVEKNFDSAVAVLKAERSGLDLGELTALETRFTKVVADFTEVVGVESAAGEKALELLGTMLVGREGSEKTPSVPVQDEEEPQPAPVHVSLEPLFLEAVSEGKETLATKVGNAAAVEPILDRFEKECEIWFSKHKELLEADPEGAEKVREGVKLILGDYVEEVSKLSMDPEKSRTIRLRGRKEPEIVDEEDQRKIVVCIEAVQGAAKNWLRQAAGADSEIPTTLTTLANTAANQFSSKCSASPAMSANEIIQAMLATLGVPARSDTIEPSVDNSLVTPEERPVLEDFDSFVQPIFAEMLKGVDLEVSVGIQAKVRDEFAEGFKQASGAEDDKEGWLKSLEESIRTKIITLLANEVGPSPAEVLPSTNLETSENIPPPAEMPSAEEDQQRLKEEWATLKSQAVGDVRAKLDAVWDTIGTEVLPGSLTAVEYESLTDKKDEIVDAAVAQVEERADEISPESENMKSLFAELVDRVVGQASESLRNAAAVVEAADVSESADTGAISSIGSNRNEAITEDINALRNPPQSGSDTLVEVQQTLAVNPLIQGAGTPLVRVTPQNTPNKDYANKNRVNRMV